MPAKTRSAGRFQRTISFAAVVLLIAIMTKVWSGSFKKRSEM